MMLVGLLRRLGVEAGERRLFALAAGVLFCLGWAEVSVKNVGETYFVKRVGVDLLPLVFLFNSVLLVATTWLVGRAVTGSRDRVRQLAGWLGALGLMLVPLWALVGADLRSVYVLLVIVSKQLVSIGLLVFVLALGDLLNGRQAKRLFAPLMAAMTLGTIIGSFASGPLSLKWGLAAPLPGAVAALLLGSLIALQLRRLRRPELAPAVGQLPTRNGGGSSFSVLWRESRLFKLLFTTVLCSGLLGPMLYFQFSYVADLATQGAGGEARLLAFYASFRGWLYAAVLVGQLGLSARIYRRIGLPLAAAISPIIYLLGFLGFSVRLSLPAGVFAMSATKLQDGAVYDPALRVLLNLFPEDLRSRATALLEGPVKRAGGALGNLVALAAVSFASVVWVGYLAIPITLIWLVVSLALWRVYPVLLLQASSQPVRFGEQLDVAEMLDPGTLRGLSRPLRDPDPQRCSAAIDVVAEAPADLAAAAFASAARAAGDETRALLVAALDRVLERTPTRTPANHRAARDVAELLARPGTLGDRDRADAVQAYGRLTAHGSGPRDAGVLETALEDPSPAVQLAARAARQCGRGGREGEPELDDALARAVASADPVLRRTAREEYRALLMGASAERVGEPRFMAALLGLASLLGFDEDRPEAAEALADVAASHGAAAGGVADAMIARRASADLRVRRAVLRFIGHAGLAEHASWLVQHASGGPDGEALVAEAREGLRALGPAATEALLVELTFGHRTSREAILPLVRELEVGRAALAQLYDRELDSVSQKLVRLAALQTAEVSPIVIQRLRERRDEGLHTALLLLAAVRKDDRISDLADPLRRARDSRERAILIEAVESLLSPVEQRELLPLLESARAGSRALAAAQRLGVSIPSGRVVALSLLEDPDDLTRWLARATMRPLARRHGLDESDWFEEDPEMLSRVDRALLLKSLPPFEGLTTRQLMDVAELVAEESHPATTAIVEEGEQSSCMYLIVDGGVSIRKRQTVLTELGPGDFFGEIAVFEGSHRTASVVTGEGGARLLRLGRDSLLRLMEEVPSIAISVVQSLSRRVLDLTDRVAV